MAVDIIARAMAANASGGSKDVDYGSVTNKPQINGITLEGNKTTSDLGIGEIIELKGTEENPIELANIGEPGIYKISGYVKYLLTSSTSIRNGIILEVAKNDDAISQHYWDGNSAFSIRVRVTISGIPFTENFHELSQNGDIENYSSIDSYSLINSLTLSRYLGRGYIGKVLLTDLKTTDKKSLVNAINELVDTKQDKLTAGSGITIENNVISALGGGNTEVKILSGTYDNPIKLYEITEQGKYLINGYAKETSQTSPNNYYPNSYILIVLNVNNTIFQYIVGIFNLELNLKYRIGVESAFQERSIVPDLSYVKFDPYHPQNIYTGKQIGDYYGIKSNLETTDKSSLVAAINEVARGSSSGAFPIIDATGDTEVDLDNYLEEGTWFIKGNNIKQLKNLSTLNYISPLSSYDANNIALCDTFMLVTKNLEESSGTTQSQCLSFAKYKLGNESIYKNFVGLRNTLPTKEDKFTIYAVPSILSHSYRSYRAGFTEAFSVMGANELYAEIREAIGKFGSSDVLARLSNLTTTDKTSLVNAINEINAKISSGTFATNLAEVQGYDATKTQVLKNINGQFMWVDEN